MTTEHASFSNAPKINHKVSNKRERTDIVQSTFSDYNECNRLYFPKVVATVFLLQGFPEPWHFPWREEPNSPSLDLVGCCSCLKDGNPVELILGDTRGRVKRWPHFQLALSQRDLPVKPAWFPEEAEDTCRRPVKAFFPRTPSGSPSVARHGTGRTFRWFTPSLWVPPTEIPPRPQAQSHEQNQCHLPWSF